MPRRKTVRAGIGATGVRGRPRLKRDVIATLSPKRKLEINVARNIRRVRAGMKAQTVSEAFRSFGVVYRKLAKERGR